MSARALLSLTGGVLLSLLPACDRGEPEAGERGLGSGSRDQAPLVLELRDETVNLEVQVASPGRAAPGRGTGPSSEARFLRPPAPQEVKDQMARFEPGEQWLTERQSEVVRGLLRELVEGNPSGVLADEFVCSQLRPSDLKRREFDGGIQVLHPSGELPGAKTYRGTKGFTEALGGLLEQSPGSELNGFKFKILELQELKNGWSASVLVEFRGVAENGIGRWQANAHWHTRWAGEKSPRLTFLEVRSYEESRVVPEEGFIDLAPVVLASNEHFDLQVNRGIESWADRLTRLGDFSITGHHGLAVGDVNGDGRDDLYVCDAGSLPNRLYIQQSDGTAVDVSAQAGVDWLEDTRSALLVDLDNDGDQDLVLATIAMIVFLENDGTGRFSLQGGHEGARYPFSLSASDFDQDGLLDLYVCVYSAGDSVARRGFEAISPLPFNDAENGGRNVLLKNLGNFEFADATAEVGLEIDNRRWSFAASWEDYDRDGDSDLYVANDFGRNCLYRNVGGRFEQVAAELGVEDMASGMSVAWSDYNRDGYPDLYVGNMFSAAGSRITRQEFFRKDAEPDSLKKLRRMARGNTLFSGTSEGNFLDLSVASRAHRGGWAWSSGFADVNNDGWEDLVIANGFLTGRQPDDL